MSYKTRIHRENRKAWKETQLEQIERDNKAIQHQVEKNEYMGVQGVKQIMDKANIKEAAAVFSLEGITVFAQMLEQAVSTAVNKAVNRVIEERMISIIDTTMNNLLDQKLVQVFEGSLEGLNRYMEQSIQQMVAVVDNNVIDFQYRKPAPVREDVKQEEHIIGDAASPELVPSIRSLRGTNADLKEFGDLAFKVLQNSGEPMRLKEICACIKSQHLVQITQATNALNALLKREPRIQRIESGVYIYKPISKEENFEG